MPSDRTLQGTRAISGTFGSLIDQDGNTWAEAQRVTATVRVERRDIKVAGSRHVTYKPMGVSGEGEIGIIKAVSRYEKDITAIFRNASQVQAIFNLRVELDDPEALGAEKIRLLKVKFWQADFGFNVDNIEERSFPFTFEGLEILQEISGDPTDESYVNAYRSLD